MIIKTTKIIKSTFLTSLFLSNIAFADMVVIVNPENNDLYTSELKPTVQKWIYDGEYGCHHNTPPVPAKTHNSTCDVNERNSYAYQRYGGDCGNWGHSRYRSMRLKCTYVPGS